MKPVDRAIATRLRLRLGWLDLSGRPQLPYSVHRIVWPLPTIGTARAILSLLSDPPWPGLLLTSLLSWMVILWPSQDTMTPVLCLSSSGLGFDRDVPSLTDVLSTRSPLDVLVAWIVMLTAMMSLVLASPLRHVWHHSLRRLQMRNLGLFLVAFVGIWLVAGLLIGFCAVAVQGLAAFAGLPVAVVAIGIAALWQVSPWKQFLLARCHLVPRLSVFGWPAMRDCTAFGFMHGLVCIGTCWALMLVPMVMQDYHAIAMALVSGIMIFDRLR